MDVASHGEDTGYEVPCLIVAAKDDLNSFPMAIQESTRVVTSYFFADSISNGCRLCTKVDFYQIFVMSFLFVLLAHNPFALSESLQISLVRLVIHYWLIMIYDYGGLVLHS